MARGQHNLDAALASYSHIPCDSWQALRHIVAYETGWIKMLHMKWAEAVSFRLFHGMVAQGHDF